MNNVLRTSFLITLLMAGHASAQQAEPAEPAAETQAAPEATAGEAPPDETDEPGETADTSSEAAETPADGAPPAAPAKPAIAADPEKLASAKAHFKQGLAFAKSGDCSAAIVEFLTAFEVIPRPNMLYNIAQCQERLFRYDLAVKYYTRYLEDAPPDAPDRGAVTAALNTLGNLLGTVHIKVNVECEVWVDDRLAGTAPGDVLIPAGGHSLELRSKGYIPELQEVRIVGRTETYLEVELVKAQTTIEVTETTGVSPTLFWIGVSATTVTAVVGGFFALQAKSRADETEEISRYHPDRAQGLKDTESSEFTADLSFAIASALGLGTVIIAFVTDWDGAGNATDAAVKEHSQLKIVPLLGTDRLGLGVAGSL